MADSTVNPAEVHEFYVGMYLLLSSRVVYILDYFNTFEGELWFSFFVSLNIINTLSTYIATGKT
ncbi:hypothetical protein EST38_g11943 [Candolleomyces aberdarensis]|uniref:Uncharacterized protein n=1 Tax=Candolleomyces aberdarensis TaxID=2316362 RepID=A0A4Q2D3N9_9AGAR|nr:hypothetical protein EST38_g11943 [Candolleomyces aberdarensis]